MFGNPELNALEDTEGALIGYGRSQVHRDSLAAAAASSDKAADLARKRTVELFESA